MSPAAHAYRIIAMIAMALCLVMIALDVLWCIPHARPGHERWCSRPAWAEPPPY